MPTLIRLFLVLVVLAGLGFAGMFALTVMVDPGEKDITIKIPARELVPADGGPDIIDVNDLPAPVNVAPRPSSEAPVEEPSAEDDNSEVETVEVPGAE
ncbi:MAG: hypothetical protein ABIY37_04410 [Devosia sp.]